MEPEAAKPPKKINRNLSKAVVRERRILELWETEAANCESMIQFCEIHGPANKFGYNWLVEQRKKNPAFRERMDKLEVKARERQATGEQDDILTRCTFLARARWQQLSPWKGVFLELYRETKDRLEAARLSNKTWTQVEAEIEVDAAFKAGYAEIFDELIVASDDAALRRAAKGLGGAQTQAVLETQSSLLSKSRLRNTLKGVSVNGGRPDFTQYDVAETRERAKELFRRCLDTPKGPDAPAAVAIEQRPGLAAS